MDIRGKVAIVTGGGSGIGRATAVRLASEGAAVVVADVDEAGSRETVGQIEAANPSLRSGQAPSASSGQAPQAVTFRADVSQEADVRAMIAFAEATFGGLDILHNNAGIITGRPRFPDAPVERWSLVLDVNLRGVVLGIHYGVEAMRRRGGGVIVSTASMAGIIPYPPDPIYSATKGGVVFLTQSLAHLKDEANIRVNCVCPGVVDTPMLSRALSAATEELGPAVASALSSLAVLQPEEIADAVVELIRDDSLAGCAMMVPNGAPRRIAQARQWQGVAGGPAAPEAN